LPGACTKLFVDEPAPLPRGPVEIYASQPVVDRNILSTLQLGERITGFERGTLDLKAKGLQLVVLADYGVTGFAPTHWNGISPKRHIDSSGGPSPVIDPVTWARPSRTGRDLPP
jgi:hypothetical protein